jgi:hypothetical protein
MTITPTALLSLPIITTGTESGTWGDVVDNGLTSYLDIAIAGGLAITITTADVTLANTAGTSAVTNIGSTTAQYAILNVSGAMTAARNLILPSSSREYTINNSCTGGFALTVKGAATTGVTLRNNESAKVVWDGSDYVKVGPGASITGTNMAVGTSALGANTTGVNNTAIGSTALALNSTGSNNTVVGSSALSNNSSGISSTVMGRDAALSNTTGGGNVVIGRDALRSSLLSSSNVAIGQDALYYYYAFPIITAGAFNIGGTYTIVTVGTTNFVAIGASANTIGVVFVATGVGSGTGTASRQNSTYNTVIGYAAGTLMTTGIKNTIIGCFNGNQSGLNILTKDNYIVLSDGDGNPRAYWNGADATFNGALTTTGAITSSGTAGVGYATGAGGAVTQTVSRTNPTPSINRPTGSITLVSAAGTTAYTSFTVNNNTVAATDAIILNQQSGTDKYELMVTKITASTSFEITFRTTGGTTTETPVFNFAVIKGVAA